LGVSRQWSSKTPPKYVYKTCFTRKPFTKNIDKNTVHCTLRVFYRFFLFIAFLEALLGEGVRGVQKTQHRALCSKGGREKKNDESDVHLPQR
jgi:hypothetical protein